MGFIHEEHGRFAIETRQESFIVHAEDEPQDRHPEYFLTDAPDLIEALLAVFPVGEPERAESHCSCGWSGSFAEGKAHRAHHRAAALAEPVESTDDERLRARAAKAMAEADDKMLPDQTYRLLARAAVAAVRAASKETE